MVQPEFKTVVVVAVAELVQPAAVSTAALVQLHLLADHQYIMQVVVAQVVIRVLALAQEAMEVAATVVLTEVILQLLEQPIVVAVVAVQVVMVLQVSPLKLVVTAVLAWSLFLMHVLLNSDQVEP
jgi:hypothetical protein